MRRAIVTEDLKIHGHMSRILEGPAESYSLYLYGLVVSSNGPIFTYISLVLLESSCKA
jgi:hypothetical protein